MPTIPVVDLSDDDLETEHLEEGGKKKPRRKKKSQTARQKWSHDVFRQTYDELAPGETEGLGCGCRFRRGWFFRSKIVFEPCRIHADPNDPGPSADIPVSWARQKEWAREELIKYLSLPMEQPNENQQLRAARLSLSFWPTLNGYRPKDFANRFFGIPEKCACLFEIRIWKITSRSPSTRHGHYFRIVRMKSCGGDGNWCNFDHLPLNPRFGRGYFTIFTKSQGW